MIPRMIPMRTSTIFKSRWMALLWAAGVIWFAYDFAAPSDEAANTGDNRVQVTDATGSPVSPDDEKRLQDAVKSF
jgi:hypothetical protein